MLAAYFIHDQDGWRLKGHARQPMMRWMAQWAVALTKPSDVGGDDTGYNLPGLKVIPEIVEAEVETEGQLFATDIGGVTGGLVDPRLPALGHRIYGPADATDDESAYWDHCRRLGVPGPADWGEDKTSPIEANFDLLNGIDFQKGCFVGQETTSRMKRRGSIRNRMLPLAFDGPPPPFGTEVLNGELRAGEVLGGRDGMAMALLRLDRLDGALTVEGRPVEVRWPRWLPPAAYPARSAGLIEP
jgi:folate-binding protein YgfZ